MYSQYPARLGAADAGRSMVAAAYNSAKTARDNGLSIIKRRSADVPQALKDAFGSIDQWFLPSYEAFLKGADGDLSRWASTAQRAKKEYLAATDAVLDALADVTFKDEGAAAPRAPADSGLPSWAGGALVAAAVLGVWLAYRASKRTV